MTQEQITSMSEVVAKYMGSELIDVHCRYGKLFSQLEWQDMSYYTNELKYHSSWDWIHEVWEKVSSEEIDGMNQHWYQIELSICGNEKDEAFWALHRAIVFINQNKKL